MSAWDLRTFRNDLSIFIQLLKVKGVTGDFSQLDAMLIDLGSKNIIEYVIKDLAFYITGSISGTLPPNQHYCQIFLDNMLMVNDPLIQTADPLYGYYLDFNISIYPSASMTKKAFTSSWHLDRHPNAQNVKYTHPLYHFQFGGKKLELIDPHMSVLSCPRIPHPPMDIFLATHFILSNYFSNKQFPFVNDLLAEYDYQMIIKRAQQRLWQPYFTAFDATNTNTDLVVNKLFPLFLN